MARRRNSRGDKKSNVSSSVRKGVAIAGARPSKGLSQVNSNAAGIDIGANEHFVAVPSGRDEVNVRRFGTFTADLYALADWLQSCKITTVAVESTGIYWIALYEILESRGLEVRLVDPRKMKQVPGRKTDVLDCQWIQELHTYGLLEGSFRPDDQIVVLRAYMRQRQMLIQYAGQHVQHVQKALEQMNIKLTEVIDDVMGETGSRIIEAILFGERGPQKLAKLRDYRCKNNEATIALALEGNWRKEHLLELRQAWELYGVYQQKLSDVDAALESHLKTFADRSNGEPLPPQRPRKAGKNEPQMTEELRDHLHRMTGLDLTLNKGFGPHMVLGIISEAGLDMTRFPTKKHFASWLGLCPGNHKTGGRQKKSRSQTRHCSNNAATWFRMGAAALINADCALGAFARRLRSRLGSPKAITAVAHKLATIFYNALRYGRGYIDKGAQHYELQYRVQAEKNLRRKAAAFGFVLMPMAAAN
jgi:transposase